MINQFKYWLLQDGLMRWNLFCDGVQAYWATTNPKQRRKFTIVIFVLFFGLLCGLGRLFAQDSSGHEVDLFNVDDLLRELTQDGKTVDAATLLSLYGAGYWFIVQLVFNLFESIVEIQLDAVDTVGALNIATNGAELEWLVNVVSIGAAVGCFIKISQHYMKTDRHDSLQSILGYFQWFGLLVLFIFSNDIVDMITGVNQQVNTQSIASIGKRMQDEVLNEIKRDKQYLETKFKEIDNGAAGYNIDTRVGDFTVGDGMERSIKKGILKAETSVTGMVKYVYFAIFGGVTISALAIPAFIVQFMAKVLLAIALLGVKIVFIAAFIPRFENLWVTFLLNIVNIMLWIPIFNVIIGIVLQFMDVMIGEASLSTGEMIFLSIATVIMAIQSFSLTLTASNMIVNGAGAGAGSMMGGLASFGAATMMAKGASTAATVAGMAIAGSALKGGGGGAGSSSQTSGTGPQGGG